MNRDDSDQRSGTSPMNFPNGYHCVVCGRSIEADEYGVIVHDDIPHPPGMDFAEEEKPQ